MPVQPPPLDDISRELLDGMVNTDPLPGQRITLRTQDIQDPAQAKAFMRTQYAKHMEHYLASKTGTGFSAARAAAMSTERALPSTSLSPARISELRSGEPKRPPVRP